MSKESVNLLVENVSVLNADEELEKSHEINAKGIIDNLSNYENLGINVSDRIKEDELSFKQFKLTITYDSKHVQFSVGFPWRDG